MSAHVTPEREARATGQGVAVVKKILLVEDDEQVRDGISALLAMDSYEIQACSNAAECRSTLERFHPDVVVLDLHLPDAVGTEFWSEVRELCPSARIIFSTGSADDEEIARARLLEVDVLLKPYDVNDLIAAIERAGGREA
jgi:DNA-binding response OmpR family regulator